MFEKFVLHHINLNGSSFIFIKIRSFVVAEPVWLLFQVKSLVTSKALILIL